MIKNDGTLVLNPDKFRVALAVNNTEQRDVARAIGRHPTYITHIKKHVFFPSPDDVRTIAKFLGYRIEDLFERGSYE